MNYASTPRAGSLIGRLRSTLAASGGYRMGQPVRRMRSSMRSALHSRIRQDRVDGTALRRCGSVLGLLSARTRYRLMRRKQEAQRLAIALGIGAGIGALLMFWFDPASGGRRRWLTAQIARYQTRLPRPTWGRLAGTDQAKLVARVCKEVPLPETMSISATDGVIMLTGIAENDDEMNDLVRQIRRVRGVKGVSYSRAPLSGAQGAPDP